MSFVYPAGLWALLGAAVLVLVCLLRRRYDVTLVSSTYLWRLSERFRRKKNVRRLKRALLFLLQLACVLLAALLIAQPVIPLPGAGTDVAVILDASGSMRLADAQGQTRFARALSAVERDAAKLPWGASVTVILAGDEACIAADHVRAGADVRRALDGLACGWGEGDLSGALSMAQRLLDEGSASQVCLYTDKAFAHTEQISVVNTRAQDEWNVTIRSLRAEGSIYGTAFVAEVVSFGRDANVTFDLYVDGEKQPQDRIELRVNGEAQAHDAAHCPEGQETSVSLLLRQTYDYADVRVVAHADDGLSEDNEYRLYRAQEKTTRVLLAGEKTYFLENALSVFAQVDLTCVDSPEETALEGHDIYVFDGCLPQETPADGTVWMVNPPAAPQDAQITFGDALVGSYLSPVRMAADSKLGVLTQNLTLQDAAVARFREVTSAGRFTPVLLCGRLPVLLAGRTDSGCAQLMLLFDLQESNLPLLPDFIVLLHNMLEYSAPPMLPAQTVQCGDVIRPQTLPLCEKLFLQSPDMSIRTLEEEISQEGMRIAAPGGYTLLQELRGGKERALSFFAHMPAQECSTQPREEETLALTAAVADASAQPVRRSEEQAFHPLRLLAALMLALLLLEWGVYHREKY